MRQQNSRSIYTSVTASNSAYKEKMSEYEDDEWSYRASIKNSENIETVRGRDGSIGMNVDPNSEWRGYRDPKVQKDSPGYQNRDL